jgi:hypothetical protein
MILTDKTELVENLTQYHFFHHKPTWNDAGRTRAFRGDRPAANRLSNGTV